ncbi:MAG: kynureninase [Deltaproteobacteria bacterium]|nr:MAG: kynureninase [Deltaproteobacteria bacterium]
MYRVDRAFAEAKDRDDPLAPFRARFVYPENEAGEPVIYFCGNSLGLQPKEARDAVLEEIEAWARLGVRGHHAARHPWLSYHERFTRLLCGIVGSRPEEVVLMNTLTVNLHLLMVSFYRPTPQRYKIAIEASAFPSDIYAVASQLRFHGFDPEAGIVEITPAPGEASVSEEAIEECLKRQGEEIALLLLGGVNYYTGQYFDLARITKAAHAQGCLVGFDLAHAAGNVPLALHDWGVDFAAWCSYKYLNGGPGCVAGAFVHERHLGNREIPRFEGWWGHNKVTRFQMPAHFDPIPTVEAWQLSNPPILSLAPLYPALSIFEEAGMTLLRKKSVELTGYLEFLIQQLDSKAFSIITPSDPERRGAQLSIRTHRNGRECFERLSATGVVCDWREPDVIRVAPTPLYNTFTEVHSFAERLRACAQ